MNKAVLIAHYNKPLEWVNELKVKSFIYTSGEGLYVKVRNRGNDASHYLSFIIDRYDKLPERTVFCHDHEKNWTQEHPLPYIINHLNWGVAPYFSIGARCNYWTAIPVPEKKYHMEAMQRTWPILNMPYPELMTYFAGTQFCVHKDLILQHEKAFYQRLRDWVYTTQEAEWFIGRFFEYTWHYIFTGNPIETNHKYLWI